MRISIEFTEHTGCEIRSIAAIATLFRTEPGSVRLADGVEEPHLYPGLKDLENATGKEIVNHVISNRPRVKWTLEKAAD